MKKIYLYVSFLIVGLGLHGYASTIYVNKSASGSNTGASWANAYTSLQTALSAAVSGDQIWVAKGTYYPSSAYSLTNTSRYYHFEMKEGVAIYGGFAGTETTTADRISFGLGQTNETILSGDVGTVGTITDNCYHVIYNPATLALTSAAVIDGFTIKGGYAYTSPSYVYGGGMYNCSSSPTLLNITFISNSATYGGAICNLSSSPTLINVAIVSNTAGYGGGIYNSSSSPTLINVTIAANTVTGYGGGLYNKSSSPVFWNSILWGNLAATTNQIYNESGTITFNYSCYANGIGDVTNSGILAATNNNITSNPLFYNAMGNDFRLTANSPCLDAGYDSYNTQAFDIRGKGYNRKLLKTDATQTGIIDMGAYEYLSGECTTKKIYVNASASGSNNGTTWNNAYTSLQSAITGANFGDIVWVATGTYKPSSAYNLTGSSRYYHFEMKEGVAIYGGFAGTEATDYDLSQRDFTINNTTLSGDIGTVSDSTDNCYHIIYNPGTLSSSAMLDGFTITKGVANGTSGYHCYGGGICNCSNATPTINNTTIVSNYGNNGGGMFNYKGSSPVLNNVKFVSNKANYGAGIYNWSNCSPVLSNVEFSANIAIFQGGGMVNFSNSSPQLTNVVLVSNKAIQGGGMYNESSSSPTLTNVTIALNSTIANTSSSLTADGGGLYFKTSSSPTIKNCIIWGNTAGSTGNQMYVGSGCTATLHYSCYANSTNDIGSSGTFTATDNNITLTPIFADADNGDFRIKKVSPCTDAGNSDYNSLATDIRGTGYGRKLLKSDYTQTGTIDMGAYEYNSNYDADVDVLIIYVKVSATGNNDGTSWTDAYTSLQTALDNASAGDHIWVAAGKYKPSSAYDLTDESRYYHFEMKADVAIYGGFAGNEARNYDLSLRDFITNKTTLSGDLGTQNYYPDNCYHVIYNPKANALTSTAVLDGFTVTCGNANGSDPHKYGAGMYNYYCSPTVSNVIFTGNTAIGSYGCGGGMYNEHASLKLTDVVFTENQATQGGGMYNTATTVTLVNVSFTHNYTNYSGGGMYCYNNSTASLTNCLFAYNYACSYGGGLHAYDPLTMTNCTFAYNKSDKGGGLACTDDDTPVLNNCIFWADTAVTYGDEIYTYGYGAKLNYSCYANNDNNFYDASGTSFTIDANSITTNPQFINASEGDFRINDNSPCIDKGNNSYNATSTDIRGQARVQNSTIDMGAYEWTDGLDYICTDPTNGGEISANHSICSGTKPVGITSISAASGNKGTLEYKWQKSTTSATDGFSDIASSNSATFSPGKLTTTTWYKRCARAACMDDWTGAAESNTVCITIVAVTNPNDAIADDAYTYDGTEKSVTLNLTDEEEAIWINDDWDIIPSLSGTNVGKYSATLQITNSVYGCYSDDIASVNLVISKATLTVTPNSTLSKTYGDTDPELTYTCSPALSTIKAFSIVLSREAGEDAGTYKITLGEYYIGENYSIALDSTVFTINPKTVTVTPDANQSKEYGESDPVLIYTYYPELLGSDTFTGELSREVVEDVVNDCRIMIGTLSAGKNYTISLADEVFTITPKAVTVTPQSAQSKMYGDSDPVIAFTYNPGLITGDTFNGDLSRDAGEDAGDYDITIGTLSAGNNYSVTLADAVFTITQKPVSVIADAQSKTYGETDPELTFTVSPDLVFSDSFTGSLSRTEGEDVGTYAISQNDFALSSNYILSFTGNNLTIAPKEVTVTADAQSKVYGDADPVLTYNVLPALAFDDAFTGSLSRENGEDAGTYAISQSNLALSSNYILSFTGNNMTITPKEVTVTADVQSKVYGETDPVLTYTVSPSLVFDDTFTGSLSREEGEDVGTYAINQNDLALSSNYILSFTGNNLTITPKEVIVTADTQSKVYGDDDPVLTYSISPALVLNDTFTGSLSREEGEDAGKYAVTIGSLSAGDNYSIHLTDVDFVITAKPVTVTPDANQSKVYGGDDPVLTYSVTPALIGDDTFSGTLNREAGEDVGNNYAISIGNLTAGSNYSITFIGAAFTITPKTVTVVPDANQSKVYGEDDPMFTYSINPSLIGDDTFTGVLSRETGEDAGSYAFTIGTLNGGSNYTLIMAEEDFTISPLSVNVVPYADQNKEYGEPDPAYAYSSNPALIGEDTFTGALTRETGENAGTYAYMIGTLTAGNNYVIDLADGSFTITPKAVTVIAGASQSKTYGDIDPVFTYTSEPELISGNSFLGSLTRTAGENIGKYAIETGSLSAGSNYTINFIGSNFEITARQLTISDPVLTAAKQYDGTTVALVEAGSLFNVISADQGNVTASAQANYDNASAGSDKIITVTYTLGGLAAGNYLAPLAYSVNTGIIYTATTIDDLRTTGSGCEGGTLEIAYTIATGEPVEYQILFGEEALAAGFTNTGYTTLPLSSDTGNITMDIPEGIAQGNYTAQLQFRNSYGDESDWYGFTFSINLSSDYLINKFDDVVLCDNSSKLFTAYQWYKNDELISGATNQYYCDPDDFSGTYYVQVTTTDGQTLKTCPVTLINSENQKVALNIFPNPVPTAETFVVEVTDVKDEDLAGAVLHIYDILGSEVYCSGEVKVYNYLKLDKQSGNFIIRINPITGKVLNGKISIVK
jgi:hypothetical protein